MCAHRTSQVCAQFACATGQISDPINTIRTQACQFKLILINASRECRIIISIFWYNTYAYSIQYILPVMLSVPAH